MQSLCSAPVVNIYRIIPLQAHTQTYKGASLDPSYNMLICGSKSDDWIISSWAGEEMDIGVLSVWWADQRSLCSCLTQPWWIIHMKRDCWEKRMSRGYRWQRHDHRVYFLYLFLTVFLFQSLPHVHFLWTWMFLKKVCEGASGWREWKLHLLFEQRNFSCWKTGDYHNLSTCSRDTLSYTRLGCILSSCRGRK